MPLDKTTAAKFLDLFHNAEKPADKHTSALEAEYIGFFKNSRKRVSFEAITEILQCFLKTEGFQPYNESGHLVELKKGLGGVSLEPGLQLEFGSSPRKNLQELEDDARWFEDQLLAISEKIGVYWVASGYDPFSRLEDIPLVPKKRYAVMRSYLAGFGPRVLNMMAGTAGCQMNIDYSSMEDMAKKMRLSNALAMIAAAMFANSCFFEGRVLPMASYRSDIWNHVDPARAGYVMPSLKDGFSYMDYAEYAAAVPMLVLEREGGLVDMSGVDFREFAVKGARGIQPVASDWKSQLSFTFPFARLRNTIETRTTDAGPLAHTMAMLAFWKGLFYSEASLNKAFERARGYSQEALDAIRLAVPNDGMQARVTGLDIAEEAAVLLEIACQGLEEQNPSEVKYLDYLQPIVESRQSLAEKIIASHTANPGADIETLLKTHDLILS